MLDLRTLIAERSVEDILAGVVRFRVDGELIELPVLSRAKNRRWLASLDGDLAGLLSALDGSADTTMVMSALTSADEALFELLVTYDEGHVLGTREELDERIRPNELLAAVLGVWRAANPLADIGFLMVGNQTATEPPAPPTSSPRSTGGRRASSKRSSRTSSTSPTSMPPSTAYAASRSNG